MKNWKVELTAGGECLAGVNIQRNIFQEDLLFPLQFITAMIPFNRFLRKSYEGFRKAPQNVNHSMYMVDVKLLEKKKK